jgi:tetratricopeptide (TPR) repeat protein
MMKVSGLMKRQNVVCILMAMIILVSWLSGCSKDPGPEVWVIGLDGADWDQLGPMMDRGELPHLASLKDGGASGILRSDMPMISPILWTSIATGKTPDVHGVTWFMTDAPDGSKMPISSYERQVRTFWNIASEADRRVGIVGWWATWPAEPVNGWLASDYVAWHSFGVTGRSTVDQGKTWPPEFMQLIEGIMPSPMDIPESLLERMVHLPANQLLPDPTKDPYADPAAHLRQAIATSRGFTDVVLHQLDHERPELMSVYYEGTDAVTHLFGDFQDPRLPWVSDEDYRAYRDVINEYWKWQDELLGELLAKRGPQTTVLVISDHGFRVGDERRKEDEFNIETADADHMPDGLIIINGPDVATGVRLKGGDIYDVAPTVLYAMGLPVGNDMAGHVLTDAFTRESLRARPVETVGTYETSPLVRSEGFESDDEARENLEQMLKSLGYISGAQDEAGGETRSAEQVVNLATVLMRQGRADEAVAKLREALAENPGHMEIRLNLAQALSRSGDLAGGEKIYRELVAEEPARLEFHQDLATCLSQGGGYEAALAAIDAGLVINPEWVEGLTARGLYLFHLDRLEEARTSLDKSLRLDPRQSDAYFNLGQVQDASGDLKGATTMMEKAHQLDPGGRRAALGLAGVLEKQGQFARAMEILERTLELGGEDPAILGEMGAVQIRGGRPEEAVAPLEQAQRLDPDNADIAGNLGMAYAMTGQMPAAIKAFEKVVDLRPDLADGQMQLGSLYHQAGRLDEARRAYKKTIELDPDLAPAYYNLGLLERSQGNTAEGQELITKARRLDPSLPER